MPNDHLQMGEKRKKTRQKATIDDLFSVKYILADAWLTWERICLKLIFWLQVEEIRVALWKFRIIQAFRGKIKSFKVGQSWPLPLFICCNFGIWNPCTTSLQSLISSETRLVYPFLGVLCCCIRWGIRFHAFLATSQKWLFSGFHFLEPLVSGCTC